MSPEIIEIDVEELWRNDYSWRKNIFTFLERKKLGNLFLKSAMILAENPETPARLLPLSSVKPLRYVEQFKKIFKSIRENGYIPTDNDIISVYRKGGTFYCCDGHRRLVSIMVIGKQKRIRVVISPRRLPGRSSPGDLFSQ